MALLPTIPTSFVPRAGSPARAHITADFGSALSALAYVIFIVMFLLGIGVFFYGRILAGTLASKEAELAKAEAAIDPATVHSFVQLRDRLNSSQSLLAAHLAPSGFFTALESILPTTVRFTSLHMMIDNTGVAKVDGIGISKSFNALSAASEAFAGDGRIKDVIFSKMTINSRDSSVAFGFSATLAPELITFSPTTAAASSLPTTSL
jgi:hypothetical protein